MKIIAIYNEPDFHYEVFGFVFECAKRNGFHVNVYCTMDKKWIDFYKNLFHHIDFYDIEKTHIRPKSYDAIILTTHSNKIEKTNKVLSIAHLIPGYKQQDGFDSRIPVDYKYKYCMIRRVLPSFILNVHTCFSYNFPLVKNHNFCSDKDSSVLATLINRTNDVNNKIRKLYWTPVIINDVWSKHIVPKRIFAVKVPRGYDTTYGSPDPFLICGYIFAEIVKKGKGIIAVAKLRNDNVLDFKPIIEENFHMSYPNVFQYQNHWYMIPETYQSGAIFLYKATNFPYKWERVKKIYELDGLDSTPFFLNGNWFIFTTSKKTQENHLLTTTSFPLGTWSLVKKGMLKKGYRGGGQPIYKDKMVILPLQPPVGNHGYGYNLELFIIGNDLTFTHKSFINPPKYATGIHHLSHDVCSGQYIVDLRQFNFKDIHDIRKNPSGINICMVGGVAGNDWDILRKLAKNPDIFIHFINRYPSDELQKIFKDRMKEYIKASPSKLFSIIHSCDFLLVAKKIKSDYTHIQMSGSIPIAISTLTPIIGSVEMINSLDLNSVAIGYSEDFVFSSSNLKRYLLKYNEKNLKLQREILIEDTGRTMKQLFPKLYIEEQTVNTKIPKIINFMWIQKDDKNSSMGPPKKYEKQIKSWKIRNPEYKVIIWNGKDIKKLLSKYLSDDILHILYNRIPTISLCDISRSLMIYELGGLYTDLDFHCCKRIDKLLSTHSTYFIREPPEHEIEGKHLCTGFLGSVPKNNFIYEWFKHQIENIQKFNNENLPLNKVVSTTGPRAFWEFYQKNNFDIYIGDYCDILPILDNQKVSKKCLNTEPYTYNAWNEGTGWGIISLQKYTNIIFIVLLLLLIASTLLLLFSK